MALTGAMERLRGASLLLPSGLVRVTSIYACISGGRGNSALMSSRTGNRASEEDDLLFGDATVAALIKSGADPTLDTKDPNDARVVACEPNRVLAHMLLAMDKPMRRHALADEGFVAEVRALLTSIGADVSVLMEISSRFLENARIRARTQEAIEAFLRRIMLIDTDVWRPLRIEVTSNSAAVYICLRDFFANLRPDMTQLGEYIANKIKPSLNRQAVAENSNRYVL